MLPLKILGDGEFSKKLTIVAKWYSKSAHKKIVDAGGTANNHKGEAFAFPKPKPIFVKRDAVKKVKKEEAEVEGKPAEGKPTEAKKAGEKPAAE